MLFCFIFHAAHSTHVIHDPWLRKTHWFFIDIHDFLLIHIYKLDQSLNFGLMINRQQEWRCFIRLSEEAAKRHAQNKGTGQSAAHAAETAR